MQVLPTGSYANNASSASQVAAIRVDDNVSAEHKICDITVSSHSGETHKINYYFGCCDPLQYPLVFPHGDTGWHQGIEKVNIQRKQVVPLDEDLINLSVINSATALIANETAALEAKRKRFSVSCREYYCYKLQIRPLQKSILLHGGRLFQQYVVDFYVKV